MFTNRTADGGRIVKFMIKNAEFEVILYDEDEPYPYGITTEPVTNKQYFGYTNWGSPEAHGYHTFSRDDITFFENRLQRVCPEAICDVSIEKEPKCEESNVWHWDESIREISEPCWDDSRNSAMQSQIMYYSGCPSVNDASCGDWTCANGLGKIMVRFSFKKELLPLLLDGTYHRQELQKAEQEKGEVEKIMAERKAEMKAKWKSSKEEKKPWYTKITNIFKSHQK